MQLSRVLYLALSLFVLSACAPQVSTPVVEEPVVPAPTTSTGISAKLGSNAIYLADQQPGTTIVVNVVNHEKDGYVVIFDDNDGTSGAVLGVSALLSAGTHNLEEITLDQEVADGAALTAALYVDNGDGTFDITSDTSATDFAGNSLMMYFTVSAEATDPRDVQIAI